MNERINELANKAGMVTEADFASGGHFAEKFAELIVQECASLVVGDPTFILEHFGVEE